MHSNPEPSCCEMIFKKVKKEQENSCTDIVFRCSENKMIILAVGIQELDNWNSEFMF